MASLIGAPPRVLLEQPVFDAEGRRLGRVGAVGIRHGQLHQIAIEAAATGGLCFVGPGRFTVERDRVVLTG